MRDEIHTTMDHVGYEAKARTFDSVLDMRSGVRMQKHLGIVVFTYYTAKQKRSLVSRLED